MPAPRCAGISACPAPRRANEPPLRPGVPERVARRSFFVAKAGAACYAGGVSTPHPIAAAQRFTAFIQGLAKVVVTRGLCQLLPKPVEQLILDRIRRLQEKFHRLVARIAAGTYKPRRTFTRKPSENPRPREIGPVPQRFGWVQALMAGQANSHRGWLQMLLEDPETVALIQQAPTEFSRIFRPLCWMLRLEPPPILAKLPRKPRAKSSAAPRRKAGTPGAAPQPPPPPVPPAAEPYPDAYRHHQFGPLRRKA